MVLELHQDVRIAKIALWEWLGKQLLGRDVLLLHFGEYACVPHIATLWNLACVLLCRSARRLNVSALFFSAASCTA